MPAPHNPSQPPRSSFTGEELEAYDRVVRQQKSYNYPEFMKSIPPQHLHAMLPVTGASETAEGVDEADRVQPYMGAMLNSPLIMGLISDLGAVFRSRGERDDSFSHADREWVDLVLSEELKCWGVYYSHMYDAVAVGVRVGAIRALRSGCDEDLEPAEFLKARFIRQVARGTVTSESYQRIVELFGVRGAVEYTAAVGWLVMTIRLLQAFGSHAERTEQMVNELVGMMERGEIKLPSPRARVTAKR